MTITPHPLEQAADVELYEEARRWIADCTGHLVDDLDELTDTETRTLITRNYTGGWNAFAATYYPTALIAEHHPDLTAHYAGPFCGCGDHSCPVNADPDTDCTHREP